MSAYNPYFEDERRGFRPSLRFSRTEVMHIGAAVAVLTVAFTLVLARVDGVSPEAMLERFRSSWRLYAASLVAVSSGFVLHELGHKALAQRYGHWAEFRGQFGGLLMSLAFAAGVGFLFAAPGAVLIYGRVTPKENGLISLMGPGVNFGITLVALPFTFATDPDAFLPMTMAVVAFVNALLCVFNLLPLLNLDGRKVLYWSKTIWFLSMAAAVALLIFTFSQVYGQV